jgi:hypothetical protein
MIEITKTSQVFEINKLGSTEEVDVGCLCYPLGA